MLAVDRKVGDWTVRIVDGHAELPVGMTCVPDRAFEGCKDLTSVTIGASVTEIGERAFAGCSSLAAVTIPDSVTAIGDYIFCGCSSLAAVTIPDTLPNIGANAFPSTAEVTRWTVADYRRAGRWRRLRRWARLADWLAPRLRAAYARAVERSYAPGGAGYLSAATDFSERAKQQSSA